MVSKRPSGPTTGDSRASIPAGSPARAAASAAASAGQSRGSLSAATRAVTAPPAVSRRPSTPGDRPVAQLVDEVEHRRPRLAAERAAARRGAGHRERVERRLDRARRGLGAFRLVTDGVERAVEHQPADRLRGLRRPPRERRRPVADPDRGQPRDPERAAQLLDVGRGARGPVPGQAAGVQQVAVLHDGARVLQQPREVGVGQVGGVGVEQGRPRGGEEQSSASAPAPRRSSPTSV